MVSSKSRYPSPLVDALTPQASITPSFTLYPRVPRRTIAYPREKAAKSALALNAMGSQEVQSPVSTIHTNHVYTKHPGQHARTLRALGNP
jgi:hypothetical protein